MVRDYVASCTTCTCAKSPRHKPYGKLKQLPIPSQPWSSVSVSMDFIKHTHVFSKHGVLSHVTSDCGSEFILHFFCSLGKLLQMRLHFTSGYHLEGDRQTECTNQVLEQYLQVYTNYQQDNWAMLLLMAEFTYNNAMNAMTGVSPFFVNKGYHPEFTADPQVETLLAKVQTFVADLECIQVELKENITQAQERYRKNVDKHRSEAPELNVGDQAYVKARFFRTR